MSKQSEAILEENLLKQLSGDGKTNKGLEYERVVIQDDKALESNLKYNLKSIIKLLFLIQNLKEY